MYNEQERVWLAKKEYVNLKVSRKPVTLYSGVVVGYVSQANNKLTGEQSFVLTDKYVWPTASLEERSTIKEITILYRGSTAPSIDNVLNPSDKYYYDMRNDWLGNDLPTALQILKGDTSVATSQLRSSVETLKEAMCLYPNAQVYVYGHSLGSMNAQYAVANVSKKDIDRIQGGFFMKDPISIRF